MIDKIDQSISPDQNIINAIDSVSLEKQAELAWMNKREHADLPSNSIIFDFSMRLKDFLAGNEKAFIGSQWENFNIRNILNSIEWAQKTDILDENTRNAVLTDPWRLNFVKKPPTIEEFLTREWIGGQADTLHDWARKALTDFWTPSNPYRAMILYTSIGAGKSTATIISMLYSIAHFELMRNPWVYFKQSPSTIFVVGFASWSQKKGSELYYEPFRQVIEQAPKFEKVKFRDKFKKVRDDKESGLEDQIGEKLFYTTATDTSLMEFGKGCALKTISSTGGQMGLNIMQAAFSELSFFIDEGGWTNEKIWQFYTKTVDRVSNRMKGNYYGRTILDSSPNNLESCIDKYINGDAKDDPKNLIITGSRWALFPFEFPKAIDENNQIKHDFEVSFPLFKGNSKSLPKVLDQNEYKEVSPTDVIWCPKTQIADSGDVDFYRKAKLNPVEFMRDWCARPVGGADRILYDEDVIESCFPERLRNIYYCLELPYLDNPEGMIWNKIKNTFFVETLKGLRFYYEPYIKRVVSVDLSETGDPSSISMSHLERLDNESDSTVMVTDFSITIIPKGSRINQDAIKFFIRDLRDKGNLDIAYFSFDSHQSEGCRQYLERIGFTYEYVTADKNNEPYNLLIDRIWQGTWKCGKNIFVKNNLRSLHWTKRANSGTSKIDHFHGDVQLVGDQEWSTSQIGYNAKDNTDTIAENAMLLHKHMTEFQTTKVWTEEIDARVFGGVDLGSLQNKLEESLKHYRL